jgi:hypothetical protein
VEPVILTDQDIAELNRSAIDRSATIARIGGGVLVVVGALGVLAWLWAFARTQAQADSFTFVFGPEDTSESPGIADRLDLAANSVGLLLSAFLVVGLGLLLRSASEYFQARMGGSITGFVTGDHLEDNEDPDIGLLP